MNTTKPGAKTRRKLSLGFRGKAKPWTGRHESAAFPIPDLELRQLVAAMVD
jgi:hypothetical protein